jgi:hypothetical protein
MVIAVVVRETCAGLPGDDGAILSVVGFVLLFVEDPDVEFVGNVLT